MYLIVGLGNPESDYAKTRHNMGFNVINVLAEKFNIQVNKTKFKALYGTGEINGKKVILVKPQTFMNLSGEAIIKFINFYKLDISKVIVIYDDIDLPEGAVKVRKKGGAGTHNGMKSVIENLKTTEFPHIRIGTGKPLEKYNLIDYVIGKLTKEEYEPLIQGINYATEAIEKIIKNGIDNAMNQINAQ